MKIIYHLFLIAILGSAQYLAKSTSYVKSTTVVNNNGIIDKNSFEATMNNDKSADQFKVKALSMKKKEENDPLNNVKMLSRFDMFDSTFDQYEFNPFALRKPKFMNFFGDSLPKKNSYSLLNMSNYGQKPSDMTLKAKKSETAHKSCNEVTGFEVGVINSESTKIFKSSDCYCNSKHCGLSYTKPDADSCLISKINKSFENNCQVMLFCKKDEYCDGIYVDDGHYFKVHCDGEKLVSHQSGTNGQFVIQLNEC